jgi:5-methylthioadenosine/S-adenosylhomocysteine deaminase
MRRLISNISIITQNKKREIIPRGFIILKDNQIESVGSGLPKPDRDIDSIIDGAGLIVTPGLVNAHVHLGETVYQDFLPKALSLEDYLVLTESLVKKYPFIEEERKIVSDYSACRLIENGISTIAGGRIYESAKSLGLRSVSGYMVMRSGKLGKLTVDLNEKYREERLKESGYGLNQTALFVHSLSQVGPVDMEEVKNIVVDFPDTLLMIHVAETRRQEDAVKARFGQGSILTLKRLGLLNSKTVLIHCNWLAEEDLDLVQESGASIVHCLSSNINVADRILDIVPVLRRGINLCLATDGVVTAGTSSVLEEARKVYGRSLAPGREAIPPQKALDMITIDAAKILGLDQQIGSLEEGKGADLAFWSGSSLSSSDSRGKISLDRFIFAKQSPELQSLMIDGKLVMWYKELLTEDKEKIIDKFRTLTKKIKELENGNNISESAL